MSSRKSLITVAAAVSAAFFLAGHAFAQSSGPSRAVETWRWHSVQGNPHPTARHENGFVAVGDRLYLLGGRGNRPLEAYDPATKTWTRMATPPMEIHHVQAVSFNEKLYVVGALTGNFPEETPIPNVLVYDPATDAWTTGKEIPQKRRRGGSGVVVHAGHVYIVGGNTRGHMSGFVPWLDRFDPSTGDWVELPDAPHERDHFHAVVLDGKIYAAGGRRSAHDLGHDMDLTVEALDIYDIESGAWSSADAGIPTQRAGAAAAVVDGKIAVIGGESMRQVEAHTEVEAYDPETRQWMTLPPLPLGRHGTQATLHEGRLHFVAGSSNRGGGPEVVDHDLLSAETLQPQALER
jgi:N-acetylneuraminic acid mutarotase